MGSTSSYNVCHVIRADGLVFDGWAYSALFRRRWLTVNGRFTQARNKRSVRQIARWRAGADTDAADAVLAGVGLGLLAVGAGETALAVLPEHAMSVVSEAVAAGAPRLPGPLAPARPRLDVLTLIQAGSTEPDHDHYVYRSAFPANLLREATADASSLLKRRELIGDDPG